MTALPNKPLPMSWFQCTTCWKKFKLRIQLATHIKKRHNEEGFVRSTIALSENESYRAKTDNRDEGEKVTPPLNMTACHAVNAFISGFDCNKKFTDLQMWSAHCSEEHNSVSRAGKTSERRVEVFEEKVAVTTSEDLVNSDNSTVTNLVRQSTFASQSNHLRVLSPLTNKKKQIEVLKFNRLRRGVMLHKGRPRRCPYCPKNFLLSVDLYRHIKAVHGKLLTRIATGANCNESKKTWIHTAAIATISKSSNSAKSQTNDTKPDVGPGSTYSIKGYKCQLCLKTFPRLAVFNSHLRVRKGCFGFIQPFVAEQAAFLLVIKKPG